MATTYKMAVTSYELDSEEVDEALIDLINKRAKIMKRQVTAEAPTRTGEYKRGWENEKIEVKKEYGVDYKQRLKNIDRYMLTHLLAYEHRNKWGTGTTPAASDFADIIKRNIKNHKKEISNFNVADHIQERKI